MENALNHSALEIELDDILIDAIEKLGLAAVIMQIHELCYYKAKAQSSDLAQKWKTAASILEKASEEIDLLKLE